MPSSPTNRAIKQLRAAMLVRDGAGLGDGELLGSFIKRHDEAALAALIKRHGPMVWGVCRRLLNHHDAEDAFQGTFVVLVRKAASIVPREMIGNWLYGVAFRTALQARRSAARRRARESQVTVMPDTEAVQQDQWPDVQSLLDQELSRLPDNYRAIIVLCDLEGRTRREVAIQLRVPEGTVAGRLSRARGMLRKRLAHRGVTLSAGAMAAVLIRNVASGQVPDAVVSSAIRAASFVAVGKAALGPVSVKAVALAEGVLKAMLMSKLKIAFALALVAGLLLSGGGVVVWQTSAQAEQRMPPAGGSSQATPANEQLTKTLVALDKQLWDAAGSGDWKVYDRLLADDFVGRSTISGGIDKRATLENVRNQRYADWTIRNVEAKEISKDVAILRYVYSCKVNSLIDGSVRSYRDRHTTLVWAHRNGAWVLVFCQENGGANAAQAEQRPATPARQEPELDKEGFIAWGKEINGIQAGLGFLPDEKRVYHHGETATVVLRVRNVGKQEVEFKYIWAFFLENPPTISDADGKTVQLPKGTDEGRQLTRNTHVAPGKTVEVYEWKLHLQPKEGNDRELFTIHGTGKFSIQCERVVGRTSGNPNDPNPTLSKLATGKLELEIKSENPASWGGGGFKDYDATGKLDLEIKSEKPASWGGGGGKDYELRVDRTVKHGGKASASIKSITTEPTWYGAFTQAFQADNYRGQRLRMTAYVKSKDVENSAGVWMRMEAFDGKGHYSISSDFMGDRSIKGTNDWKEYEVVMDVPKEGAALIYFGVLLAGKGQVWVDDFKFEVVGNDVKTTGRVRETGKATGQPVKGVPTVPRNLDFED